MLVSCNVYITNLLYQQLLLYDPYVHNIADILLSLMFILFLIRVNMVL